MSRTTSRNEYRLSQALIALVYLLLVLIGALTIATANADTDVRASSSKQYVQGGRAKSGDPIETRDEYAALVTEGARETSRTAAGSDASPGIQKASADDFWIYDADVILFGDDDDDGFFYGVDLLFDADTIWSRAEVYAVLYLSFEGGPWNEYAITEDFLIRGATSDDEYVVVTELESGYLTGDYDILIELLDADTGEFLTDFGPESSSALSFLPLEDYNRDAPTFDRPVTVSRESGGGGAAAIWLLMLLAGAGLGRARRREQA